MIKHYLTSKQRPKQGICDINRKQEFDSTLCLDIETKYQQIIGFGGAFTEAAAYTLSQMSESNRIKVLEAYFDKNKGLNYTIGRVHIHSCDFALENYTYIDDFDETLDSFDISRDFKWVIPMIKDAEKILGKSIDLLASPWSPPAWMKSNNEMNNGGKLLPKYYQLWADYFVKFIDKYKEAGLNVTSVTVQNEPAAVQVWDSCIYTAEEERDFIKNYLGPTLKNTYPEVKIIIWDHNRDIIVERGDIVYKDKEASKYVGWIDTGDYMEYTLFVPEDGIYTITYRVASESVISELKLYGKSLVPLTTTSIPVTGGWQEWQDVESSSFSLSTGVYTFKIKASVGGLNVNYFEFKKVE